MKATFARSAASAADFPAAGPPEIALVGRSNVGKSTLINALGRQTVARTSAAPGKTRLANFCLLESRTAPQRLFLVDLPGYGYARGGEASIESFAALTREYFAPAAGSRRRLAGVLHLIDARHPELPQDAAAFDWLRGLHLPLAVVATKIDKLNRAGQRHTAEALAQRYQARVLPVSAADGTGLDDVRRLLRDWAAAAAP